MAPFNKPSWLALLVVLTLTFVSKAAVVDTRAAGVSNDADVNVPAVPVPSPTDPSSTVSDPAPTEADAEGFDFSSSTAKTSLNTDGPKKCKNPLKRREWRSMSKDDRLSYIRAVQCMQRLKPKEGIKESRSRYDDFQGLHIMLMTQVHLVGQFLPWHRFLLAEFEKTLRAECDYKLALPFWDWTQDTNNFPKSPVFDTKYGFGSLVQGVRRPITDGPFANYKLIFGTGPYPNITEHIVERSYNVSQLVHITSKEIKRVLALPTFEQFRLQLEGAPVTPAPKAHDGGHYAVGGDLGDFWSSPGEPLFWLHHAQLDRIWWTWQNAKPGRVFQISGRTSSTPPFVNVTLDWELPMGKIAKTRKLRTVMDIEEAFCVTYDS